MLKVLVDEDMPRPVAALLRSLDIDVADVRDVGLKGSTDAVEKFFVRVERDKLPNNLTILQTRKYRIRQLR